MSTLFPASLVLVGAGKMGGAMLDGWLAAGLEANRISVIDPLPSEELKSQASARGFSVNPDLASMKAPEVLVLGIKPQMLDAAAPTLKPLASSSTLVVSILAGKTIGNLASRLPDARAIVRAMPNLPASVGRGITGAVGNAAVSAKQKEQAHFLLSGVGQVEWVDDEALIDAVTGVSGSGPAYVFYLVECLAKAAEAEGLPPDLAQRLQLGGHRRPIHGQVLRADPFTGQHLRAGDRFERERRRTFIHRTFSGEKCGDLVVGEDGIVGV